MEWSYDWLSDVRMRYTLDLSSVPKEDRKKYIVPKPLQFANIKRLENGKDVFFVFDEAGGGKTLISGLMASHYLYNNPNKDVLVLTTNAMVYGGQFKNEWINKLPQMKEYFEGTLEKTSRVTICNHHISNIQKIADSINTTRGGKPFGLIIIDEAQVFYSADMFEKVKAGDYHSSLGALFSLSAEKVVFLTATPYGKLQGGAITEKTCDLDFFADLGACITNGKVDRAELIAASMSLTATNNGIGKTKDSLICSQFDLDLPVTRYFKDTVEAIATPGYVREEAKWEFPEKWEYYDGEKENCIVDNILSLLSENDEHKFIIFTDRIEKELRSLADLLKLCKLPQGVDSIYGSDPMKDSKLEEYSKPENVRPTVLIISEKIGEVGINLPGYDYVINAHIPPTYRALEQRIGRVDRMNSKSAEIIHMVYPVPADDTDNINYKNYVGLVDVFARHILGGIPCKNAILTKEMLETFMERYCGDEPFSGELSNDFVFFDKKSYDIDKQSDINSLILNIEDAQIGYIRPTCEEECLNILRRCGEDENGRSNFDRYCDWYYEIIREPLMLNTYRTVIEKGIEEYVEKLFISNSIEKLFTYNGKEYEYTLDWIEKIVEQKVSAPSSDIRTLKEFAKKLYISAIAEAETSVGEQALNYGQSAYTLPVVEMLRKYACGDILRAYQYVVRGDKNASFRATCVRDTKIVHSGLFWITDFMNRINQGKTDILTDEMISYVNYLYSLSIDNNNRELTDSELSKCFFFELDEEKNTYQASPWLKYLYYTLGTGVIDKLTHNKTNSRRRQYVDMVFRTYGKLVSDILDYSFVYNDGLSKEYASADEISKALLQCIGHA